MPNELGNRSDVIERQLAHRARNKVRASYNQAEYLGERRAMMQAWANLIDEMAKEERKVILGRFVQASLFYLLIGIATEAKPIKQYENRLNVAAELPLLHFVA